MNASHIPPLVTLHAKRISERLKVLQGKRSQRAWASELGVPQQVLSRYLNGSLPRLTFLIHLARRERVNLNWLMMGEGEVYR